MLLEDSILVGLQMGTHMEQVLWNTQTIPYSMVNGSMVLDMVKAGFSAMKDKITWKNGASGIWASWYIGFRCDQDELGQVHLYCK